MPDDERPSLEAPQLFGRRRNRRPARPAATSAAAPAPVATPVDEPASKPGTTDTGDTTDAVDTVFEDSGTDATAVLPTRTVRVDDLLDGPLDADDRDDDRGAGGPTPTVAARPRRTPRDRTAPLLPGRPAALVAGVAAGLALLAFTWLGFQGCEAVRGTTSCGTGPGMVALVVVFVLSVAVGGVLLSRFGIPDPGATSFVGTGLTGIFYLLAVDYLDNWTVLVVVPAVTAVTFLGAWYLTTAFVDLD